MRVIFRLFRLATIMTNRYCVNLEVKFSGKQNRGGKRNQRILGAVAALSILMLTNISPAFAAPQWHYVGWWLADLNGQYWEKRGTYGFISPLNDPFVPSGKRSSSWVGAQDSTGDYWIRVGWYKDAASGYSCVSSSGLTVYAERWNKDLNPQYACVSGDPISPNVAKKYEVLKVSDQPGGQYRWFANFDGALQLSVDFPFQQARQATFGQVWDEPTNPTTELYSMTSLLTYYNLDGSTAGWARHIEAQSTYYKAHEGASDKVMFCNEPPDLDICHF